MTSPSPAWRVRRMGGLRVVDRGQVPDGGAPVLLLHGFTGSADAWGAGVLEGLAQGTRVLAVDLPGHGESVRPADPDCYRMDRVLTDLLALLEEDGVARADWVGYSMGGRVALAAAVLHPERVRRLVLESASPGLASPEERERRRRSDEALARRLEEKGMAPFVDFWMRQPIFASQRNLPESILSEARRRRLRNDPEALAAVLKGLGTGSQPSFWDRLPEVQAETLLLTGALDGKYEALAARMLELLPRARHRSIPDAGHTVHLEAPRPWFEAVGSFLSAPSP